jgi:hypothetical protein
MSKKKDWLAISREDKLAMAKKWIGQFRAHEKDWSIPTTVPTNLELLMQTAATKLELLKNEDTSTPTVVKQCRKAFVALTKALREDKVMYIHTPPLEDENYTSLGLKIPDRHPTPGVVPLEVAYAVISKLGRKEVSHATIQLAKGSMAIETLYLKADDEETQNRQICLQYIVLAAGIEPPEDYNEWPGLEIMTGHHTILKLGNLANGKTLHCVLRVMNGKLFGEYGPVTKETIS